MNKRKRTREQREAFEELQRRKKRQLRNSQERREELRESRDLGERTGRKRRKRRRRAHQFGLFLSILQAVLSAFFVGMLYIVGMIPMKFILAAAVVLLILFIITFSTQLNREKRAIGGKLLSMLLIVCIAAGSFYIGKINGVFSKTTNASYKIDNMVVAVLKANPAETLKDAKDYTFGVQYKMGGNDVQEAIDEINNELEKEIELVEFDSLQEQAEALHNGAVDAIIYNEGYTDYLNEAFIGYKRSVKIIYEHKIQKELSAVTVDKNVQVEPFSVFISGIDVYGEIEQTSRSDVNIIATVNPKTHQVLLITTPRDYYVPIPGVSRGQKDKLTHAGNHGVDVSMKTLEQLYQTEIPFFVRINFTSMIQIVDQLGGVDVYSEYAFRTSRNSEHVMNVKEGLNHFNGEEALAFSRERENVPGGDNQRGKNQQAVITAMIKKMISPQMLLKASGVIDSVAGNVETNMADKQIQALIKNQLNKGGSWNIYSVAAEGEGLKTYCYSIPDMPVYVTVPDNTSVANIQELINRVENGEILEGSEVAE